MDLRPGDVAEFRWGDHHLIGRVTSVRGWISLRLASGRRFKVPPDSLVRKVEDP